jgi:hypothetical protein
MCLNLVCRLFSGFVFFAAFHQPTLGLFNSIKLLFGCVGHLPAVLLAVIDFSIVSTKPCKTDDPINPKAHRQTIQHPRNGIGDMSTISQQACSPSAHHPLTTLLLIPLQSLSTTLLTSFVLLGYSYRTWQ